MSFMMNVTHKPFILIVIILRVVILNAVVLSVVMLSVVAPLKLLLALFGPSNKPTRGSI
jgi:hypothetical protein